MIIMEKPIIQIKHGKFVIEGNKIVILEIDKLSVNSCIINDLDKAHIINKPLKIIFNRFLPLEMEIQTCNYNADTQILKINTNEYKVTDYSDISSFVNQFNADGKVTTDNALQVFCSQYK